MSGENLLLDFIVEGEISEADTPTIWLGATPSGLICVPPELPILPFLRRMPFLLQPSQFILAWDRHQEKINVYTPAKCAQNLFLLHYCMLPSHMKTESLGSYTFYANSLPLVVVVVLRLPFLGASVVATIVDEGLGQT